MSTAYDEPAYEVWGYDDEPDGETLTMADIHDIAMSHADGTRLAHSYLPPASTYLKLWAGREINDACAIMNHKAKEYGWTAVIEITGSTGYWVVDIAGHNDIKPELVQIIAEVPC